MSVPAPNTAIRARLTQEVGRLADRVAATELDDAALATLCSAVADLADGCEGGPRPPWWKRGPDYGEAYRADSPLSGTENPWAPDLRIEPGPHADAVAVRGRVRLGNAFAGPPRAVHGGVVAGLFDEVFGGLGRALDPTAVIVTATLEVRYRRPTPLDHDLLLDASVDRRSGRRVRASAVCVAGGDTTASARALMLLRPRPGRKAA